MHLKTLVFAIAAIVGTAATATPPPPMPPSPPDAPWLLSQPEPALELLPTLGECVASLRDVFGEWREVPTR